MCFLFDVFCIEGPVGFRALNSEENGKGIRHNSGVVGGGEIGTAFVRQLALGLCI